MEKIYLNNDWEFAPEFSQSLLKRDNVSTYEKVRIPHTTKEVPYIILTNQYIRCCAVIEK